MPHPRQKRTDRVGGQGQQVPPRLRVLYGTSAAERTRLTFYLEGYPPSEAISRLHPLVLDARVDGSDDARIVRFQRSSRDCWFIPECA